MINLTSELAVHFAGLKGCCRGASSKEELMPGFGKRRDLAGSRRGAPRQPVVLVASAVTDGRSQSAILEDVCSTGAKLRCGELPNVGQHLCVKIGSAEFRASVAWVKTEVCGIAFETPIDQDGVRQIKVEGRSGAKFGIV
jgi:hypothetical protein